MSKPNVSKENCGKRDRDANVSPDKELNVLRTPCNVLIDYYTVSVGPNSKYVYDKKGGPPKRGAPRLQPYL